MLTGHAVSNVFNGVQELDSGGKEKVPCYLYIYIIYYALSRNFKSENKKSGLIVFLLFIHSVHPYKNYCLKCYLEIFFST